MNVNVSGRESEALWDDAATAGALGQRQMGLRTEQQHASWSGNGSTRTGQLQTSLFFFCKAQHEMVARVSQIETENS